MTTLADLMRMHSGQLAGRAVGQGGSNNPFTLMGRGAGYVAQGNRAPDWFTSLVRDGSMDPNAIAAAGRLPPWYQGGAKLAATLAGTRFGSQMRPPPAPPPRQQMFTGGWDGMRRNIGMGMNVGQAQQPQRSPFGAATLGQLAGLYGNGGF